MKKKLLLGALLLATSAFAEMEVERGYGNIEFSASYNYTSSNVKGFDILKEMYNHLLGVRADDNLVREIKETIAQHPNVGGVYDLVLNSYGPGETIGSVHITVPDTMTMADIHPLTKSIAVHLYKKFGIAMTVGVYAENQPSLEVLEVRQALDQVVSLYTHVVQVHAFYVQEEKKVIYYDIIFDFDEEDPHGTLEKIKAEMQKRCPEYTQFAIVDTDFSN